MRKPCALILVVCLFLITAYSRPAAMPIPIPRASKLASTVEPTIASTAMLRPVDQPFLTAIIASITTLAPQPPTATPTETAAPAVTPSPSRAPQPAASVTGDSINVRGGPGTVYPVERR